MDATTSKRPARLTTAIVILWLQAAANGFVGIILLVSAQSALEHRQDVGLDLAAGLISVLAVPVLIVGAVGLAKGRVWVRVPVVVIELLIILNGLGSLVLTMNAGGAPAGIVGLVLAGLVLQGCFAKESDDWLQPREEPDEEPRTEPRDAAREP
ncbi:hypothetical protein [Promicromonospora sp. NPDC023987]|uniref:hypothetical protein n=1 Tax=Promicromonospora sp. NPDC023987 TaxID=3155360 RepID=UPI0033C74D3F